MNVLGIDIGGSGVKGAIVDTKSGLLISEKIRFPTPDKPTPKKVLDEIKLNIIDELKWEGDIGCGFPGVVKKNKVYSAANIEKKWVGLNIEKKFHKKFNLRCKALNDADAAGISEIALNKKVKIKGTVLVITVGTGLGTSMFIDGKLIPNFELGHLKMYGDCAEKYASNLARKKLNLTWKEWTARFNEYLAYVEFLFSPSQIIFGGGISKYFDEFGPELKSNCKIIPAVNRNNAGIIGAAISFK
ncbi:MAG: polyphosphate glucokinase [Flammeovirgaceae bacterium]|nr:polyphosphate glucokinase [Marinoscillum sp.]MAR64632.1 polyphosphate glucokinase [Flammeovirgaceae bacterium]|tara:strand:- start:4678 stop:5409 length:732 start_codon:yes stop_codon:yes gene_type:complete